MREGAALRKMDIQLNDLVKMRKTHPCGSDTWTVIRVGADIKIRCTGCGRIVMLDRADFEKRLKKIISSEAAPAPANSRGGEDFDDE